ncbi:hypothetical protein E2I00_014069, partial [Balaenoptera physalus]
GGEYVELGGGERRSVGPLRAFLFAKEWQALREPLDCGIHPGLEGMDALPYIDLIDPAEIDLLLINDMLYTETDLEESMDKIETINFHEVKEVAGIKFWCYHAGHVLGAAMFMIEIAGVKLLYTGDFSRQEDRHLMAAEIPNIKPDILIIVDYLKLLEYLKGCVEWHGPTVFAM